MHDNNICDWCGDATPEDELQAVQVRAQWREGPGEKLKHGLETKLVCDRCYSKRHKIGREK